MISFVGLFPYCFPKIFSKRDGKFKSRPISLAPTLVEYVFGKLRQSPTFA